MAAITAEGTVMSKKCQSVGLENKMKSYHYLAIFIVFVMYLFLRGVAWQNTTLLEDHDSLLFLHDTKVFLSHDVGKILDLSPDSSLFYPFMGAVFSLPSLNVETGDRLATLFFSILLFLIILGIGSKLGSPSGIIIGLTLLAFNPKLISLSFAVLTEPSYVTTVYLGLWLLWLQFKNPSFGGAALLGCIFGLAFLNRLEGVLYVVFVPLMLISYYFWHRPLSYNRKRVAGWCLVFIFFFSLPLSLQVWRVSKEMGTLAINGRQVWTLLLHSAVGKTYDEKIYGLTFSPRQTNLDYLQEYAGALWRLEGQKTGLAELVKNYAKTIIHNINKLYSNKIVALFGIFVIVFFAFGLLSLYQSRQFFEIFLVGMFIAFGLLAPLFHNVVIRHILVVAPIILLIAGLGVDYLCRVLLENQIESRYAGTLVAAGFVLLVIAGWAMQLRETLHPPAANWEYSPAELVKPVNLIKHATSGWHRQPVISARKGYLTYYTNAIRADVPYTDYKGLVRYSQLNKIDFLYLNYNLIRKFPFLETFKQGKDTQDFRLLYQGTGSLGQRIELYQYLH